MAELGEVLDAVATLVTTALYNVNGTPIVGIPATIGVGWPDNNELDVALRGGRAFVAIFPQEGERAAVEYSFDEQEVPRVASNISITFNPDTLTATVTGTAGPMDVAGIVTNNIAYNIGVTSGDTAAVIATKISQLIVGSTANGANVVLPTINSGVLLFDDGTPLLTDVTTDIETTTEVLGVYDSSFITGVNGLSCKTTGTAERRLQINLWANNQIDRDKIAKPIVNTVSEAHFLVVPTLNGLVTENVKLNYSGGSWSDKMQNAGGYMRSIVVTAKWFINTYTPVYAIMFTGGTNNSVAFGATLNT